MKIAAGEPRLDEPREAWEAAIRVDPVFSSVRAWRLLAALENQCSAR